MNKSINVLVTGCGGDIGQSVVKILKEKEFINKIVGCDIHNKHAGILLCDDFTIVSKVNSPSYIKELSDIVDSYDIDLILPISEPELRYHERYSVFDDICLNKKVKALTPNKKALEIGFDKLKTSLFLKEEGLPFPFTKEVQNVKNPKFPCILKDRLGSGSKQVLIIKEKKDWVFYTEKYKNFICQEFLPDFSGEYTCGIFKNNDNIRTIIFKRELTGGYSGYGEVCENPEIEEILNLIGRKLDLEGSINVQLRIDDNGIPKVFEINPRFSSTVLFRHLLGFNDLIWSIEGLYGVISKYKKPKIGSKFYKGFQEYIVNV